MCILSKKVMITNMLNKQYWLKLLKTFKLWYDKSWQKSKQENPKMLKNEFNQHASIACKAMTGYEYSYLDQRSRTLLPLLEKYPRFIYTDLSLSWLATNNNVIDSYLTSVPDFQSFWSKDYNANARIVMRLSGFTTIKISDEERARQQKMADDWDKMMSDNNDDNATATNSVAAPAVGSQM